MGVSNLSLLEVEHCIIEVSHNSVFSPFERSTEENDQIYRAVRQFSELSGQVKPAVLKELSAVAQLDSWKDPDITGISRFLKNLENDLSAVVII